MTEAEIQRIYDEAWSRYVKDCGTEKFLYVLARAIDQASRRAALDHCTDVPANVAAHGGDMNAAIGLIRALAGATE